MKTRIIKATLAVAFVAVAGYTAYTNLNEIELKSDLMLSNVEALASGEENPWCPNGCYDNGSGCHCYTWYPTYREAK